MMEAVVFKRAERWNAPSYKDFYIKDRKRGWIDRNGHETYEYALFRRRKWECVRRFRTRKQAYMWLGKLAGITKLTMHYMEPSFFTDENIVSVLVGRTIWKLDKKTRTIYSKPDSDIKLTAWYGSLNECMDIAKAIVERIEAEEDDQMKMEVI